MKAIIGITSGYDYDKEMSFVKSGYYEGIVNAGGLPVGVLPIQDEKYLDGIIDLCDGFLLSGGPDVDAIHFGESNLTFGGEISPCRDYSELYIARKAVMLNKPILGICRGIQVLNIAFGGTIYQDISAQFEDGNYVKHSQTAPKWYPTHSINIEENSLIHHIFNGTNIRVNSFHHQAVKDVAPEFKVAAVAEDGIIEAIERKDGNFAVGVQWHPELMWQKDKIFINLFKALVEKSFCKL